jgi:hypothetical protein
MMKQINQAQTMHVKYKSQRIDCLMYRESRTNSVSQEITITNMMWKDFYLTIMDLRNSLRL